MNWLRRLLGGEEAAKVAPATALSTAALPSEQHIAAAYGGNPIHALLDSVGLPWRQPRAALIFDYGIQRHPAYDWDVIEMPTRPPLVEGLLWPISAQAMRDLSPLMPATYLSGVVWFVDDVEANIRRAARQLEGALGAAKIARRYNTLHCEWRAGAASLGLTVWPPENQGEWASSNPSHERDPRLRTGCHINIETGLVSALTGPELDWLRGWEAVATLSAPSGWPNAAVPESQLPFVREPPAGVDIPDDTIGRSADGEGLILQRRWLYVIPVVDILRFEVTRMTPAKGPGGSYLTIVCAVAGAGDVNLTAAEAPGPDDLNDLGATLGKAFGKPVTLSPYWADC
ncbi:MAG: hypothetical protein V4466_04220 [Pseudomonadota bacterium]